MLDPNVAKYERFNPVLKLPYCIHSGGNRRYYQLNPVLMASKKKPIKMNKEIVTYSL